MISVGWLFPIFAIGVASGVALARWIRRELLDAFNEGANEKDGFPR